MATLATVVVGIRQCHIALADGVVQVPDGCAQANTVAMKYKVSLRRRSDVGWRKVSSDDVLLLQKNEKPTRR